MYLKYVHCMVHALRTLYSNARWVAFDNIRRESLNSGDNTAAIHSSEIPSGDREEALSCLRIKHYCGNLYSTISLDFHSISGPDNLRSREANSRAGEGGILSNRDHC